MEVNGLKNNSIKACSKLNNNLGGLSGISSDRCFLNLFILKVAIIFLVFIPFSDFFKYLSGAFYSLLILPFFLLVLKFNKKLNLDKVFILYVLSSFSALCLLLTQKVEFSLIMITPISAYFVSTFLLGSRLHCRDPLDVFFKSFIIFLLLVSFVELTVKFGYLDFPIYADFIRNFGDKRIDVMRVRALWASSLSATAVGIVLAFYFSLVRKNLIFLFMVFFFVALTGSRTGTVLVSFSTLVLLFKGSSFWKGKVDRKSFYLTFCFISLCLGAAFYISDFSLFKVILRAFSVVADSSFTGRSETSLATFYKLMERLPESLFFGLNTSWSSDSAFISISAGSGILFLFIFYFYFIYCSLNSNLTNLSKLSLIFISILGGSAIGDYFNPSATFFYFLIFYKRDRLEYVT